MITKKIEIIRIFVTPNDLIDLAEKIKKRYENRQFGQSNIVHTIQNDPDNYKIEFVADQYRTEKESNNKRQDKEYNIATEILKDDYYLICIDCGFKVNSTDKLPKYNDHECPGKLQHTFRAFKPGEEP